MQRREGESENQQHHSLPYSTFGHYDADHYYKDRNAAYAIIFSETGGVAAVKGRENYFLPGGGIDPGESAETAVLREIREELAHDARLVRELCRATQYFFAPPDDCHYKMDARFFLAELGEKINSEAEHELKWLSPTECGDLFVHQCHAWAIVEAIRQINRNQCV